MQKNDKATREQLNNAIAALRIAASQLDLALRKIEAIAQRIGEDV